LGFGLGMLLQARVWWDSGGLKHMHVRANLSSCMDSRYEVSSTDIAEPQLLFVSLVAWIIGERRWIECLTRVTKQFVFGFGL
jgi:hypothetical protein